MVKDGEASRGLQNDELENIRLHFSRCPNRDARCIRLDNLTLKKLIIMRKGRMGSNTMRFFPFFILCLLLPSFNQIRWVATPLQVTSQLIFGLFHLTVFPEPVFAPGIGQRESYGTSTVKLICPLAETQVGQPRSQGFFLIVWKSLGNDAGQRQPRSYGFLLGYFEKTMGTRLKKQGSSSDLLELLSTQNLVR